MKFILEKFCGASGLKVSAEKSKVFFSHSGGAALKHRICDTLGFSQSLSLGKYLGVRLTHGRVKEEHFNDMFDKLLARFSGWKGFNLSLAGRATLVQSVSTAVPIHLMQSSWLPEKVCNRLDKLNRDFLWASNAEVRKIHLVGWRRVTRSKRENGLGLRTARLNNEALLAKLCWNILQNKNSMWFDLVKAKYLKTVKLSEYLVRPGDSLTWKGIVRCMALMAPLIRWKIGNGQDISFWFDNWLGSGPLNEVIDNINSSEIGIKLHELLEENGEWNLQSLSTYIPEVWRKKITGFRVVLREEKDLMLWSETANGVFSCQSAYRAFHRLYTPRPRLGHRIDWVWRLPYSQKLKFFIWLATQHKIASNKLRKIRKLTENANCGICDGVEESVLHILRDCSAARRIWLRLLNLNQWTVFKGLEDQQWLRQNLMRMEPICQKFQSIPWSMIFVAGIWEIWKARNARVFKNKGIPINEVMFRIKTLATDLLSICKRRNRSIKKGWIAPMVGWHKLNVDGSVRASENNGAAGGVLRDDQGVWKWGFVCRIPQPTVLEAEVEALRMGLKIAWEKRIHKIEVETDSKEAWELITNGNCDDHPLKEKLDECRRLLNRPWDHKFRWVNRSGNLLADAIAKLREITNREPQMLLVPPRSIISVLETEIV